MRPAPLSWFLIGACAALGAQAVRGILADRRMAREEATLRVLRERYEMLHHPEPGHPPARHRGPPGPHGSSPPEHAMIPLAVCGFVALVGAGLFVLAMIDGAHLRAEGKPVHPDLTPRAWHHEYLGLALMVVALAPIGPAKRLILWAVGAWLMLDDGYQHLTQLFEPTYRSPLARWFAATVWRIPGVPWLVAILNRLFG